MAECEPDKTISSPIKHDWYQTETAVVITILIKNVQQDKLKVEFDARKVSVKVKRENEEDINLNFDLSHKIVPQECSYKITPSKIEVKLKKLEGIRWNKLVADVEEEIIKEIPVEKIELSGPPAYPTSKKGKDWTAVEKAINEEEKKEKPEGEEALNKLFQEIYGKGSDEVKRAMNKSYLESGGTVLSTNWKEIAKEKVEVKPPDGMEWKKW